MEELVEVIVLMEGLIPYTGYAPVSAAVWDTHAAGSMGRIGSPREVWGRHGQASYWLPVGSAKNMLVQLDAWYTQRWKVPALEPPVIKLL